jgi:hypothetical protein
MGLIKRWKRNRERKAAYKAAVEGNYKLCLYHNCCERVPEGPFRRYCDKCRKEHDLKCSECESDATIIINRVGFCNSCIRYQRTLDKVRDIEVVLKDFPHLVGFDLPPAAMRKHLRSFSEFKMLKSLIKHGLISSNDIKIFVESLVSGIPKGKHHPSVTILSLIAVVLEDVPDAFAYGYLDELAGLNAAEVSSAIRIAKECLKHRKEKGIDNEQDRGCF